MILEKIKKHSGKISFFVISLLVIVIGVLYLNQKNSNAFINTTTTKGSYSASAGAVSGNAKNTQINNSTPAKSLPSVTTKVS